MKKFFMFAAMASVALVSCVKNEPAMPVAQQDEISFESPLMAVPVKAVAEKTAFDQASDSFDVWGYFTDAKKTNVFTATQLYMNKVEISYDDSETAWKASTPYYWPNNGFLTFLAVYPSGLNATVVDSGVKITGYEVEETANVDLLVSEVSYDNVYIETGAPLVFNHVLSSVQFKVNTDVDDSHTLVLKSIKLKNINTTGSFQQDLTTGQMEAAAASDAAWTLADPKVLGEYTAFSGTQELTSTLEFVKGSGDNKTDLILLPQILETTQGTAAEIEVVYTLVNDTMGGSATPIEQEVTAVLAKDSVTEWLRGKRYTYNLTISLDEITFNPSVSDWEDGGSEAEEVTPDYN